MQVPLIFFELHFGLEINEKRLIIIKSGVIIYCSEFPGETMFVLI
jgi:hypothetical protein